MVKRGLILQGTLLVLPWALRRLILIKWLGFTIDKTARIGFSIILSDKVVLRAGARIGSFTLVKGLSELVMHDKSRLGALNWITAFPKHNKSYFGDQVERHPSLSIGTFSSITSRHYIDCTDSVHIGNFSVVGGWGTQILTHAIDFTTARQRSASISVGDHAFIGTRCVLLKGANFPSKSVLSAGSVYSRKRAGESGLYSGVPAQFVRQFADTDVYFRRTIAHDDS